MKGSNHQHLRYFSQHTERHEQTVVFTLYCSQADLPLAPGITVPTRQRVAWKRPAHLVICKIVLHQRQTTSILFSMYIPHVLSRDLSKSGKILHRFPDIQSQKADADRHYHLYEYKYIQVVVGVAEIVFSLFTAFQMFISRRGTLLLHHIALGGDIFLVLVVF